MVYLRAGHQCDSVSGATAFRSEHPLSFHRNCAPYLRGLTLEGEASGSALAIQRALADDKSDFSQLISIESTMADTASSTTYDGPELDIG